MPHIVVEVTEDLGRRIDWSDCLAGIHRELAAKAYGQLEDFKSRVAQTSGWVVADRAPAAEVVFATLHTMNPRPDAVLAEMAAIVHAHLERAAHAAADGRWVQCCVRTQSTPRHHYRKTHVAAPGDLPPTFDYAAPEQAQVA